MLALSSIACWCRLAQADLRFVTEGAAAHVELSFDAAGTYQYLRIDLRDPRNPDGYVRFGGLGVGPGTSDLRLQEDFEVTPRSLTRVRRTPQGGVRRRQGRSY